MLRYFVRFLSLSSIDATLSKGYGRMANDVPAAHANTVVKTVVMDGTSHLCLFATKYIHRDEEIVYDYGVPNLPWRKQVNKGLSKLYKEFAMEF